MKKFLFGLIAGIVSASIVFGVTKYVDFSKTEDIGKFSEEQSEQMKLEWYEQHHDYILKGMSCEEE